MRTNELRYVILNYLYKNKNKQLTTRKIFFANNIDAKMSNRYKKMIEQIQQLPFVVASGDTLQWNNAYFIGKLYVQGVLFTYRNQDKFVLDTKDDAFPIDGDTIIVKITDEKRLTGKIDCVIKRTSKTIRGILTKCGEYNFIIPEDKQKYRNDIFVNGMLSEVENYSKVEIQLEEFNTNRKPVGSISRVLRSSVSDDDKNKLATLAKHGFHKKFSQNVIDESNNCKKRISLSTYSNRVVVNDPVFIISDSYYSDYAFSASKNQHGYDVTVYIPDIAAKVCEGTLLDKAAREKAISCRLNDERIEILPQEFLNDKIRFAEASKRAAIAFKMHFDVNGHRTAFDVFEAIITPCKAINAFELFQYLKYRDEVFEDNYYSIIDDIFAIVDLYDIMNKDALVFHKTRRIERIENGRIVYNGNKLMDELIYMFGLECEKIVGEIFMENKFPIIHSYYELPSMFNIEKLNNHCIPHGINITAHLVDEKLNAHKICEFVNSLYNQDLQSAIVANINHIIGPKKYSKENIYNFKAGTITCPIVEPTKNYASLYNHRLLKRYMNKKLFNDNVFDDVFVHIDKLCQHMTEKHKEKSMLEKEYLNGLLVEIFSSEENVQEAMVFGISPSGLTAILNSGVTTLVRFDDYVLSDKEFKFTYNNVEDTIIIGNKIEIAFSHYDVKYNRLIFQYIGRH